MESCKNCDYFKKKDLEKTGFCRRYPPAVINYYSSGQTIIQCCYPLVEHTAWCGEWSDELGIQDIPEDKT